uniref:Ovule protein n=1 Tax=Panagrellus redivivus TaxID=6233 RepID=A0A7E4ULS8_PANRE
MSTDLVKCSDAVNTHCQIEMDLQVDNVDVENDNANVADASDESSNSALKCTFASTMSYLMIPSGEGYIFCFLMTC